MKTSLQLSIFILTACSFQLLAQELQLSITPKDSAHKALLLETFPEKIIPKENLDKELKNVNEKLFQLGFINAYVDTLIQNDSIHTVVIETGTLVDSIYIHINDLLDPQFLEQLWKSPDDTLLQMAFVDILSFLQSATDYLENHGQSFAKVALKNIHYVNAQLIADLNVQRSRQRTIDQVVIKGYAEFPRAFTTHALGLKPNTPFNKKKLYNASEAVKKLKFVSEIKPPEVLFTKDSTLVYLFLKQKPANRFEGLIGFSNKDDTGNKVVFNGYLDLTLYNVLHQGELFSIYWKSSGQGRQQFNASLRLPYIFNQPLTPQFGLEIYKQDSSFLNVKSKLQLDWQLNPKNTLAAFLETEKSTNLLDTPQDNTIQSYSKLLYGSKYNYAVSHPQLPEPKFEITASAALGNRKSDSISASQYQVGLAASYLWSFSPKKHLYVKLSSALLQSTDFLTNELFRLGGSNSIRGFNEESLFASAYSYTNIEYRFYTSKTAYLYSITDFAYLQNDVSKNSNNYYSLGLGYTFSMPVGIVTLSYANGSDTSTGLNLQNARFHIKLLSSF